MEFWLLDLNFELYKGRPSIWLWGVTREDRRVLLIDTYEPYFYLLPPSETDLEHLKQHLDKEKPYPSITRTTVETRRDLSVERRVLRVSCSDSESLEKCAKSTVKAVPGSNAYEQDLRPATKYQNDHETRPCQWYRVEADPAEVDPEQYSVDQAIIAANHPSTSETGDPPPLRSMGFSLFSVSEAGSPSPLRDPVRSLAWTRDDKKHELVNTTGDSDKRLLERFHRDIIDYNPDVLFSFGGNSNHWSYLTRRAQKTQTNLAIGRGNIPPHQSLYGHFSVTGRANIDLADLAGDLYDLKEKTLWNTARYLGIRSEDSPIDETEYYTLWKSPQGRARLLAHTEAEANTILELGYDALAYIQQISWLSALPADQALAAAVGFRVESYMMMEARRLGQLIPPRTDQPIIPYKGAIVLEPKPDLYDNVAALDFSSMYPSLMVKYNISPDTVVSGQEEKDYIIVPEFGHKFRKSPTGFYPIVLTKLLDNRKAAKQQLARLQKGTTTYRVLKARERATKIITNAVYGYAGWAGARWYFREVAESAAALGRETITAAVDTATKLGLKVLYGDTDSLFLEYDEDRIREFLKNIETLLGLDINISQLYKRILFTESKKKYAGLKQDGDIDVVGMEAIRGDWSGIAKEVQNRVLQMVLEDKDFQRASSYVESIAKDLKSAHTPLASFVIWKTLTRRPEDYEVNAPHVEVARKLVKAGWPLGSGDRVGYVIVKGSGKLYQRAEPYNKASLENVDYDYYVENQVLPVARRILSVFHEGSLPSRKGAQARL